MNECLSDRNFNEHGEWLSETDGQIQEFLEHAKHPLRCCSRPNKYRYLPHRCYICNRKRNWVTDLSVRVEALNQSDTCYREIAIISVTSCIRTCNLPRSFRVEGSSFGFGPPNRTAYCVLLKMAAPNYHSPRLHRKLLVLMCHSVSFSEKPKPQQRVCRTCFFINFGVPTMWKAVKFMHQGS